MRAHANYGTTRGELRQLSSTRKLHTPLPSVQLLGTTRRSTICTAAKHHDPLGPAWRHQDRRRSAWLRTLRQPPITLMQRRVGTLTRWHDVGPANTSRGRSICAWWATLRPTLPPETVQLAVACPRLGSTTAFLEHPHVITCCSSPATACRWLHKFCAVKFHTNESNTECRWQ